MTGLPYRAGVGVMLANRAGGVFVGQRFDSTVEAWQMPQGGIDPGEDPWTAALRELGEETGVLPHLIEKIAEIPDWLSYDLPPDLRGGIWKGRYRGQRQKWYAMRFTGSDIEIDVANPGDGHKPEFIAWRWEPMQNLTRLIVPFKRPVYERVVREFASLSGD